MLWYATSPSFYRWECRAKPAKRLPVPGSVSPSSSVAPACSSWPLSGHTTNLALCRGWSCIHLCLELNYNFLKGRGHSNTVPIPSLCNQACGQYMLIAEWMEREWAREVKVYLCFEKWSYISLGPRLDPPLSHVPLKREMLPITSSSCFLIISCKEYPDFRGVKTNVFLKIHEIQKRH